MPHQDAVSATRPIVGPTTTAFGGEADPLIMESFHIRPRDRPLTHYHSALVSCATATDRPRPARPLDPRVGTGARGEELTWSTCLPLGIVKVVHDRLVANGDTAAPCGGRPP